MYIFEILENECIRKGKDPLYMTFDELVEHGGGVIFDFDYDIYNPDYKPVLEEKFFLRNYEKQIGYETIFGFKRALRSRLAESLPKYNRLYELDEKKLDLFIGQVNTAQYEKTRSDRDILGSIELMDRQREENRVLDSIKDFNTEGGETTEECNKTKSENTNVVDSETIESGFQKDKRTNIYKDRPEDGGPSNLKYATNSSDDTDRMDRDMKNTDDTTITDKGSGSHAIKRASANFKDSKTKTGTKEGEIETAGSKKDYDSTRNIDRQEEYLLTRTNNNADGMLDRISQYVKSFQDVDKLILDDLDVIFSSLWGW